MSNCLCARNQIQNTFPTHTRFFWSLINSRRRCVWQSRSHEISNVHEKNEKIKYFSHTSLSWHLSTSRSLCVGQLWNLEISYVRDNLVISKFLMFKIKMEIIKYFPHKLFLKLDILKKHVCATIVKSQNIFCAKEKWENRMLVTHKLGMKLDNLKDPICVRKMKFISFKCEIVFWNILYFVCP